MEQDQLWLAFLGHLKACQPKNSVLWKEASSGKKECNYCDEPGGGALICCSNSGCRVRAHLQCALVHGSLQLGSDNMLLFSCDKHTEPIFFCNCKSQYDDASPMIACDCCEEWFHISCVGLEPNKEYDHFVCNICSDLNKKAKSPHQKDTALAAIQARKKKNQSKEALNTKREEAFLKLDPFTDTLNVDIAPIMNEIGNENHYRFRDPELTIGHVETAISRLEREILSATPGQVDYSELPADADVLRTFRRHPLVFRWRDDLVAVRDAYAAWKKSGEEIVREMCGEVVEKITLSKEHANALRAYFNRMKPLRTQVNTLRCSETDSAWFVALMECMVWLMELYRYVQDPTAAGAGDIDESNLTRFLGHLKKLKNIRNSLQAAVVSDDVGSTVTFFASVLEGYGHLAGQSAEQMAEWNRQVHKVNIANTGEVPLARALELQQEASEFPFRLPGLRDIGAKIDEARQFEKDAESFLKQASAARDLQYHENSGVHGLEVAKLDALSNHAETVHLHTSAKVHIDLVTQCMSLLSEWADVMNAGGEGSGRDSKDVRVPVSALHDFLNNDLGRDADDVPEFLKRLQGWGEQVMGRAREMLDGTEPYITKARKCLEKLTLENVKGLDKTLQELSKFRVVCEEEPILDFIRRAHDLAVSARTTLDAVGNKADNDGAADKILDLSAFNTSKDSLFPLEKLQKLQMSMNKVLKSAPLAFVSEYKREHGKADIPAWVKAVEVLVNSFRTLTNDIAHSLSAASESWNKLSESLQLSANGAQFLSKEQLLDELAGAQRSGTLNEAVAAKAVEAVRAAEDKEGAINEGLVLGSIDDSRGVSAKLERLQTECLFLPVSEALYERLCRHLAISKALTVTESLEQALGSGAHIVGAIAIFKDLILDSDAGPMEPSSSGVNEANIKLFDAQKSALESLHKDVIDSSVIKAYLLEQAFSGKTTGKGSASDSLLGRFNRLWWLAKAKHLLEEQGDMANAKKLMEQAREEKVKNLESQESYQHLHKAIKAMEDFEARVLKALTTLETASKASDDVLKDTPPGGYASGQTGKDTDEAKLNVFAGAIKVWKERLGTTSEDIDALLKELRRSILRESQPQDSSRSSMDIEGADDPKESTGTMLGNRHLEAELQNASRLCKYMRDGAKTYIDMMQAMLIEDNSQSSLANTSLSSPALVPNSTKLQLSIQKTAVVELKQLQRFVESFRKLTESLQDSNAGSQGYMRGVGKMRLVIFLLDLLGHYDVVAQDWLENATAMVPVVATRFKAKTNFRNNVKASDLEACLKQPVARAVITDVHNTILKVLSDYEAFNFRVKSYLVPGMVSQPEYSEFKELASDGVASNAVDDDESTVFESVSEDMKASELEQARQSLLLRRKQKAESMIDEGNRLSLDTRNEVSALKWAINVIIWDREAGAQAPGRDQNSVDAYYSLEKAEERERKMRGVLSRQSMETAKILVELGVMREEIKSNGEIAAVYNSDRIHPTILSSIDQLQAIGKGMQAVASSGIEEKIQAHIATITSENLSVTSNKFDDIKKDVQQLFEESISVGESRTPEVTIAGVKLPPKRIVIGLSGLLRKQTDHILSDKFRDKASLGKAISSKGTLRGARGLSQDDDSSASDGDSSSSDGDGDDVVDESAMRVGQRSRTPSEKVRGGASGKSSSKGASRQSQQAATAAAATAARQEKERAAASSKTKRPPCAGFLCAKKRALECSRYCSWQCATDAACKLLPVLQQQRQGYLCEGGIASQGQGGGALITRDTSKGSSGSGGNSSNNSNSGSIIAGTTAADRTAFHPAAVDRQSVLQEMDECVKITVGPYGVLAAGPTGMPDGDTDSEAASEGALYASDAQGGGTRTYTEGDSALETLLGSLAGTASEQVDSPVDGNSDASAILPSLPPAARNVVNPAVKSDTLSTGSAEFLLLGNPEGSKEKTQDAPKPTQAKERAMRTQYRLRLEASIAQSLERVKRVNYAGLAAALALELEQELNDNFLEPFEHQESFHSAQARAVYQKERKDMLKAYSEKYQMLRKAFKEAHNDDKVRQWLSGEMDAEDIVSLQASEFESAEAERERERIRNEQLKAALRQDDKISTSGTASDALTAVSQSEIAASAKRKRQQEEEEELRRRRKAQQEVSGGGDDSEAMDVDNSAADPAMNARKRKAAVDVGTRYAKQLKPAGVTVVEYTPGVGSNVRREGVGYIKSEKDVLPFSEETSGDSTAAAAASSTEPMASVTKTEKASKAPSVAKPTTQGKMLKKGKGILGIIKSAPTAAAEHTSTDAPTEDTGATGAVETNTDAPLYLLSNKGNAALTIQRAGAAPVSCFGKVAGHDKDVQGVLDDHLNMEGRTRPNDLNHYLDKYQRDGSKRIAAVLLIVGGDLTPDSSYANIVRELSEAGKERAALMVPEGYKKGAKNNNYEVYLVPPSIKGLFPTIIALEQDFQQLRESVGRQCTDGNTFYAVVTYVESGLPHHVDASEVVMNHAANAAQSIIASITADVLFEPEEAGAKSSRGSSVSAISTAEAPAAATPAAAGAPLTPAYTSSTAAFSATYSTGDDQESDSAFLVNRAAIQRGAEENVLFDPAPAQTSMPPPASSSSPSSSAKSARTGAGAPTGVTEVSSDMLELLTKAADHCARNGVRTYQTMREREAKQKVKTMPFLFPGQPGHDLFKAEVVRREKELKKTHSR